MVKKNFYGGKYLRSIAKQNLKIKKLFVKNNWIAHHGIERSGTNFLRAILIELKINLINQFDPAENHPSHKHFRWYRDKSLIPSMKRSLLNDITAFNINEINKICKYFVDTKHLIIKKKKLAAVTSITNYFLNQKVLHKDEKFKTNILSIQNDYVAYYDFWREINEKDPNMVQIIFYEDILHSTDELIKALNILRIFPNIDIPKKFSFSELYESDIDRKKNISEDEINEIIKKK